MILNHDELQARAHELALTHDVCVRTRQKFNFRPEFKSDIISLRSFAEQLGHCRAQCIQPAEDWLLDHIAFLETQAQVVMRQFTRKTLHQLPKLRDTGIPRIYAICSDYLKHVEGHYDVTSFGNYIESYQEVDVLKITECWALPNAMQVVLIHQLAESMREVRYRHEVCESTASLLDSLSAKRLSNSDMTSRLDRATKDRPLGPVEIVHLVRHLSEWNPDIRTVRNWLAAHVENSASSLEQMVSKEHRLQATLQVTSGNYVQSLHTLERSSWRMTFVKVCQIERTFLVDRQAEYSRMDFTSRDLLRNRVAELAQKLNVPEMLIAQTALQLSHLHSADMETTQTVLRRGCLAYYLLDVNGIGELRKALCQVTHPRRLPQMMLQRFPMRTYLTMAVLCFIFLEIWMGKWTWHGMHVGPLGFVASCIALALPVSEWVVAIVHEILGRFCRPTTLLRYDFSEALPESAGTIVVMPVIWSSLEEVDDIIRRLLVHFLANRQKNIHFAILADFCDATTETKLEDGPLVEHAVSQMKALQADHGTNRFFLFHRKRQFNSVDNTYMGWERKRGKLIEFVQLLSGRKDTSFTTFCGDTEVLKNIRYVFTVDSDTQLPIGVVSRMAGTIHFPYNRPRLNEAETHVVEGHGVLQPRIGVSFESTQQSRFTALWSTEPGLDRYAFAVFNPYQDFFGHAIFVGKGIFDVEAFQKTLVSRIPDNRVLSHDLLEGGFLRAGLTNDIEVVESQPNTFYAHERRAHRWIRGDWQLLKWLGKRFENRNGVSQENVLCGLTRWQLVDNLRRSLMSPALLLVSLLGLGVLPGRAWVWESIVLITIFLPFVIAVAQVGVGGGNQRTMRVTFLQGVIQWLTLPFTAVLAIDAIVRTLYRVFISHRNLLEWETAAQTNHHQSRGIVFVYEPVGYLVALLTSGWVWFAGGTANHVFSLVELGLWILAHPIMQRLNQPSRSESRLWVDKARSELHELASQIWSFYSHYVTAEESWLPPDNVQYHSTEIIAHRTSPTNIGLYLACVIAARDLDLIDTMTMVERLEGTVHTLQRLEKWNGHLLNWYDTRTALPLTPRYVSTVDSGNLVAYLMVVRQGIVDWYETESTLNTRMTQLLVELDQLIQQTHFQCLYNSEEALFCLGYHLDTHQKESILYDLLASEARQASFVAIAMGQVPVSHWFTLGRTMTFVEGYNTLLSWSGTMFEYLMPQLIMRTYPNTIWDTTCRGVVLRQQVYANKNQVPFGISESGYYAFDYQLNYQYRAFGVPGLGLDRGLERNLVVAPYATIMALPLSREAGLTALRQIEGYGAKGAYGYYEAVDFTAERLPPGQRYEVVQSFMAHHQGMSLMTLVNLLKNDILVKRFHVDARVRATDLLLQERIPKKIGTFTEPIGLQAKPPRFADNTDEGKRSFLAQTEVPEINVLSNGQMTSLATNQGNGMLTWNGLAVTRWNENPTADTSGCMIYLRDTNSDETWSPTWSPSRNIRDSEAIFRLDKTTYTGNYDGISTQLEFIVCSELDAEVRRLEIVNDSAQARNIEVTSFLEIALANQAADRAHPAFSKLFIETSFDAHTQCLLAKRRPREDEEEETWAAHMVYVEGQGQDIGSYEYETNRAEFIGRGNSLQNPKSLYERLSSSIGSIADPAFVMRRSIILAPGKVATVYFVTAVARSRDQVIDIIQRLREPKQANHAFHLAWVRSKIDIRHLNLTPEQASLAQRLGGRFIFMPPLTKLRRDAIAHNVLGPSALWAHGLGGDAPIMTVVVRDVADLPFVTLLAKQHQYLCALRLVADFVVLDETKGGYLDELMHRLQESLQSFGIRSLQHIIGLKASQLSPAERTLLMAVSRVWLRANGPSLTSQLRLGEDFLQSNLLNSHLATANPSGKSAERPLQVKSPKHPKYRIVHPTGEFSNGQGCFVDDGRAYQIFVNPGMYLTRPWSNILSNPKFGCLVTELGTGYSWWHNSRECKLTPWGNDPVLDEPGECLYLRDVDSGEVWSAAPKPAGGNRTYKVTHGWGYSQIEQLDGAIVHTMEMTVPLHDSLKIIRLRLRNQSEKSKKIAVTYYAKWVLGVTRDSEAPFIVTEWDDEVAALLACNKYQETFRNAVGFIRMTSAADKLAIETEHGRCSWTGSMTDFIGQYGTLESPTALAEDKLSDKTGVCSNPCGAVQLTVEVPAQGEIAVTILFGCADSKEAVRALVRTFEKPDAYDRTLFEVAQYWGRMTGQIHVKTPDRATDIMLNGWLLYQTLTCRLWARTAFYQAGGAFGFRDQLQDSLAFLHADSSITSAQILHNAAHQYEEGDVQHWWHEETNKGIRTRFSDDLLWLPYAVSRYLEQTGDMDILQADVPFLHSDVLQAGELERYEDTVVSTEIGSLWEHCLRAIHHALKFGPHGLPLMGVGDWNDGMNRVGDKGRGESVWLGWFLSDILKRFEHIAGDVVTPAMVTEFRQVDTDLAQQLNQESWDGDWFRRACTDEGTWIGSKSSQECHIDAIAQSWAVISQATSVERQAQAMNAFDENLVDRARGIVRLLADAFDDTRPSPGYIQGYPPGIRENGGQYTHGAIWSIVAWAMLRRRDKAFELFSMLNPVMHTRTPEDVQIYANEPYVMSADIYTADPLHGRAGWSWYTGAAGWMYQAGLESVLGVKRRRNKLYLQPCVPLDWDNFTVDYRYGETTYAIEVHCAQGGGFASDELEMTWVVDEGERVSQPYLKLVDDGKTHHVVVRWA